ncbi:MAG: hypothetical protein EZS28_036240, partial [Streblomastix strix]
MLEFYPGRRISAEQALLHLFFTTPKAYSQSSPQAKRIALNFTPQNKDNWVIKYDADSTIIIPTDEIKSFISRDPNADPELEEWETLSSKGFNQYMVPQPSKQRSERDSQQSSQSKRYDPDSVQGTYDSTEQLSTSQRMPLYTEFKKGSVVNQEKYTPRYPINTLKIHQVKLMETKSPVKQKDRQSTSPLPQLQISLAQQQKGMTALEIEKQEILSETSRRKRLQEENRKIAEQLQKESEKIEKEEEKELFELGRVFCPFCSYTQSAAEMSGHIHDSHQRNESIYNEIKTITQCILSQTVNNQGQITISRGKFVQCPYCKKYTDASLFENHMKKEHDDKEIQLYNRLFHKIELTLKLEEKEKLEGSATLKRQNANNDDRQYKIKTVEEKKRMIEEQQKAKIDNDENLTLEQRKLNMKIQKIDKQEKIDIDNMTVECLYCKERLILKMLDAHMFELHPRLEDLYRDTLEIFDAIQQKLIDDRKDINLNCPFCDKEMEL